MADIDDSLPSIQFKTRTFQPGISHLDSAKEDADGHESRHTRSRLQPPDIEGSTRILLKDLHPPKSSGHDVYLGSYRRPRSARASPSGENTPLGSVTASPRGSRGQEQLAHLLDQLDIEQETFGVEEHRDGYFEGVFQSAKPLESLFDLGIGADEDVKPMSATTIIRRNLEEAKSSLRRITRTRAGVKLVKTCIPFFIAYFICLIPTARDWLGRYNFVMPISTILNHAGRPLGPQVDGALLTIAGTVAGLGWGALALYVSTSTETARSGFGGVLAAFSIIFTAFIAYLRCALIRFYQFVICAGIALVYTVLAETSESVSWRKLFDYGIPFALGQALCLLVCATIFPDAGSRALSMTIHRALNEVYSALESPRVVGPDYMMRLASAFVNLSDAVRDFTIDFTITRFYPEDVRVLRNLGQAMVRTAMALDSDNILSRMEQLITNADAETFDENVLSAASNSDRLQSAHDIELIVAKAFAIPVRDLISTAKQALTACDDTILTISGYRDYIAPIGTAGNNLSAVWSPNVRPPSRLILTSAALELGASLKAFDEADAALLDVEKLLHDYAENQLIYAHSVRLVASSVLSFSDKVLEMETKRAGIHVNLPSYPFPKALNRTNAQVRHDRGGLTVGFFFRTKKQLEKTLQDLQSRIYVPLPDQQFNQQDIQTRDFQIDPEVYKDEKSYLELRTSTRQAEKSTTRYKLWAILHRLQGFETRFALKVTVVTTLLSIPAWLPQTNHWWNTNESWLTIVVVWVMMHPRVGGNVQDLFTRTIATAIGAVWAGLAYYAGDGNPYVMAAFAVILMIPMLFRYTQSSHPRSGLVGCLSFTIISLSAYSDGDRVTGIVQLTWTRGVACIVGVTAAVMVNWVIWPFIARHELRKSVATMLLHLAILYRGVVSKYVYYTDEGSPTQKDVERSEMVEGRLREAFVRIRQLLDLTNHEIRLRAPFDSKPYRALIDTCESFFNDLIQIRQFSLYFQPILGQSDAAANSALLSYRRDAVASILMVMYALASALKTGKPLPRYLPSVVAARKRLLDRMSASDVYGNLREGDMSGKKHRWADVYQFAYSKALTDVVEQVHQLHQITRLITGDIGFDHED